MRRTVLWLAVACACLATAQAAEKKAALLQVSKGSMPNDTNADPQLALEEKAELGGTALKVTFTAADASFGESRPKIRDWTGYQAIAFDVLNPGQDIANLTLSIRHKGTHGFPTRVDASFILKPGKNSIEQNLGDLANVDGSRPDFSEVRHWYLAGPKTGTTLYFGDFWLVGEGAAAPAATPGAAPAPAAPAPGLPAAMGPAQPIRITGKIGDTPVDLTITGLNLIVAQAGAGGAAPTPQPAPDAARAGTGAAPAPSVAGKASLLAVSKGSMPGDTNNDPQLSLDEVKELGGIALKVTFKKEASFGDSNPKIKDWRGYANLTFAAINTTQNPVPISVTVKHKGSKNFGTRVDRDLVLAPGKNDLVIPLAGIANNDGSAADLSLVRHWYVASNTEATILFGDFCLEGPK